MRAVLTTCLLAAFATTAHAGDKKPEKREVPNLNQSPWSAATTKQDNGLTGTSRTVIKRDMGEGWALGGQMITPYEDQRIGGSGAPDFKLDSPKRGTIFGPYLEKKF